MTNLNQQSNCTLGRRPFLLGLATGLGTAKRPLLPDEPAAPKPIRRPALPQVPFDADQAGRLQEEWAAALAVEREQVNSLGMKFVLIPPGRFTTLVP